MLEQGEAFSKLLVYDVTPKQKDAYKKSLAEMSDVIQSAKAAAQSSLLEMNCGSTPPAAPPAITRAAAPRHSAPRQCAGNANAADDLLDRYAVELTAHRERLQGDQREYKSKTARLYKGTRTGVANKWESNCKLDHSGFELLETLGKQGLHTLHNCKDIRDLLRMEHARIATDTMSDRERALFPAPSVLATMYAITGHSLSAACKALSSTLNRLIATTKMEVPVDNWRKVATMLWQEAQVPLNALVGCATGHDVELRYRDIKARALDNERMSFVRRGDGTTGKRPVPPALYFKASLLPKGDKSDMPVPVPPPPPPDAAAAPGTARHRAPELMRHWKESGLYVPTQKILPKRCRRTEAHDARPVPDAESEANAEPTPGLMLCSDDHLDSVDMQAVLADVEPSPASTTQHGASDFEGVRPASAKSAGYVTRITCREGEYRSTVRGSVPKFDTQAGRQQARTVTRVGSAARSKQTPRKHSPGLSQWVDRHTPASPMLVADNLQHSPRSIDNEDSVIPQQAGSDLELLSDPHMSSSGGLVLLHTSVARYRQLRRQHYRQLTVKEKEWYLLFNRTEVTLHHESAVNNMRRVADCVSLRLLERKTGDVWVDVYCKRLSERIRLSLVQRERINNLRWRNLTRVRFLDGQRFRTKRARTEAAYMPITTHLPQPPSPHES